MKIVTARGLTKDYGHLRAVDNVSFDVLKGECFGFLGPNGAGKTTAMSIIHCFMPPTSGEVKVFGMDVTRNPSEIKARIGVMPQDDNLDPDLTVFENLIVYARYFNIPRRISSRLAWELLDFIDPLRGYHLDHCSHYTPHTIPFQADAPEDYKIERLISP